MNSNINIYTKELSELDNKTYKRLYRLNNARYGWVMRPVLVAFKNNNRRYWKEFRTTSSCPKAYATYAKNENGTIVSWSLLYNTQGYWQAMFFTSSKFRRKGIGTLVYRETEKFAKDKLNVSPRFFPHTYESQQFFKNVIPDANEYCMRSDIFRYP